MKNTEFKEIESNSVVLIKRVGKIDKRKKEIQEIIDFYNSLINSRIGDTPRLRKLTQ